MYRTAPPTPSHSPRVIPWRHALLTMWRKWLVSRAETYTCILCQRPVHWRSGSRIARLHERGAQETDLYMCKACTSHENRGGASPFAFHRFVLTRRNHRAHEARTASWRSLNPQLLGEKYAEQHRRKP